MSLPLSTLLKDTTIHPLLGHSLNASNCLQLDFSANNKDLAKLDCSNPSLFDSYVKNKLAAAQKDFGIGGYQEHRVIYQDKNLFNDQTTEERCIHLGIDIWAPAQTPIYAPLDATIHSFQDNIGHGNYGPTIILEHQVAETTFYTLYGHLSRASLENCSIGKVIEGGSLFTEFGAYPENGNWAPHLHFQIILDLQDHFGDYPGVCTLSERAFLFQNCPNPSILIV